MSKSSLAIRNLYLMYRILGKFGELSNRLRFTKLKPSKLVNNNPLADLFIRQTFSHQMLEKSKFAKRSPGQTFPLYGNSSYTLYTYYN